MVAQEPQHQQIADQGHRDRAQGWWALVRARRGREHLRLGPRAVVGTADAAAALLGNHRRLEARPQSEITADWKHDPNLKTEVEVRFLAEGKNSTRVELEHRRLDLYGARGDEMRGIFDLEMGWKGLLAAFAASASAEQGGSNP